MDKSIEKIWDDAHQNFENLIPPVLVDLYHKKSILTIDKLKATLKKDNWSILPIAIVSLFFFVISSKIILGFYISSLLLLLFFLNTKRLRFLNTINTSQSCFDYLKKLQNMIKNNVKFYTLLLGIVFPFLVYIGFCIFILESGQKEYILETYSLRRMVSFSFVLLLTFSFIGVSSYRLTNYLVYGQLTRKIEEMIEELDSLKKM